MSKIISISDLNSYTGKTLDGVRAQQVVSAINGFIESRTGRCWGETKTVTETYDLRSTNYLRHMDVTAVSSVKLGRGDEQITADVDRYFWNGQGRLHCNVRDWVTAAPAGYMDGLEVTYSYGVTDVPDDLKLAALGLADDAYRFAASEGKEVTSASVGSYNVSYVAGDKSSTGSRNLDVVDSYKLRRV